MPRRPLLLAAFVDRCRPAPDRVIYTPDGVTAEEWENAKAVFPQPGKIITL